MPDPYASIANVDISLQERLIGVLELRGADNKQQDMLRSYLSLVDMPNNAKVLEIGCGTGVVSRFLAGMDQVGTVLGIDPSPVFIAKAKDIAAGKSNLRYATGDARALDTETASMDVVVFHTTLCHIPTPELALSEANRVLCSGGKLVIFDGDYVSVSVAIEQNDPVQMAVETMIDNFVENKWLIRKLPKALRKLKFKLLSFQTHGYSAVTDPAYMLTLIDRGVDIMIANGQISAPLGEALRCEAQRRVKDNEFFGQIAYISAIAEKCD